MKMHKIKINKIFIGMLVIIFCIFLGYRSLLSVPEMCAAVVVQNQQPKILPAGVHIIRPFVRVHLIPMNEQVSLISFTDTLATQWSVVWHVQDITKFWQVTHGDQNRVLPLFTAAIVAASKDGAVLPASINENQTVKAAGIVVDQVLLTAQVLSNTQLQATYQKMQGLAANIAQAIVVAGAKKADAVRAQGDQALINIEGQAASQAAAIVGIGQTQAIQITAPLYHKNPALFKLLVDNKARALLGS
jgi:regulator of protease activity HflC (stomatin/prohibitin superfamily)